MSKIVQKCVTSFMDDPLRIVCTNVPDKPVFNDHPRDPKIVVVDDVDGSCSEVIYVKEIQNGTLKWWSFLASGRYSTKVVVSSGLTAVSFYYPCAF